MQSERFHWVGMEIKRRGDSETYLQGTRVKRKCNSIVEGREREVRAMFRGFCPGGPKEGGFYFLTTSSCPLLPSIAPLPRCGPSSGSFFVIQQLLMQGIISVGLFPSHYLQAFFILLLLKTKHFTRALFRILLLLIETFKWRSMSFNFSFGVFMDILLCVAIVKVLTYKISMRIWQFNLLMYVLYLTPKYFLQSDTKMHSRPARKSHASHTASPGTYQFSWQHWRSGSTSVKVAGFFYEVGRKRSGILHTTVRAELCAFIEMQRSSLIVLCWRCQMCGSYFL